MNVPIIKHERITSYDTKFSNLKEFIFLDGLSNFVQLNDTIIWVE